MGLRSGEGGALGGGRERLGQGSDGGRLGRRRERGGLVGEGREGLGGDAAIGLERRKVDAGERREEDGFLLLRCAFRGGLAIGRLSGSQLDRDQSERNFYLLAEESR